MGSAISLTCCNTGVELTEETYKVDGISHEAFVKAIDTVKKRDDTGRFVKLVDDLNQITNAHPYLLPVGTETIPHPLLYWVRRGREHLVAKEFEEAEACLERIQAALKHEEMQQTDAFRRFDVDNSGKLDTQEFMHMCAYIGWGHDEAVLMDKDKDSFITLDEFQKFVGDMGGLQQLFARRRQRVAMKQWGIEAAQTIEVGARVRAHYHQDGKRSTSWREAQVLALRVMPTNGVLLAFGFGSDATALEKQVVPQSWIITNADDSDVVAALREVGILEEQQAFWASIFPDSEMRAVERLVPCQRAALATVRATASRLHEEAVPKVLERFDALGYTEHDMRSVLGWIQDLAPMVIHLHIDTVGRFLETDEYYRNQFETGTSCGALDSGNRTRQRWETELFGGAYDGCKPFDRPKYGALSVMNDFRGVTSAYQYGDSYLVLKDVRLRTSFAATDSGGIAGSRLAVLDKYAHVLQEYSDEELKNLVDVAVANTSLDDTQRTQPTLLRGVGVDSTREWLTFGFPDLPQRRGRFFFEVELFSGCCAAQVGLLDTFFERTPGAGAGAGMGSQRGGVGDDEHGWAADGQHSALWHQGQRLPWNVCWPSENRKLSQKVVVGVAVDLDARKIWFASDGQWDEAPAFDTNQLPNVAGFQLYPGISLEGRACFVFGPEFSYAAPTMPGAPFNRWPGTPDGPVRVDCPIVGDSDTVRIYKEIQLHGEVNLKQNVQRLVANRKYRDMPKNKRSWTYKVAGAGPLSGTYARTGARGGRPLYVQRTGEAIGTVAWHVESTRWRIYNGKSEEDKWIASAPAEGNSMEPPQRGWEASPDQRGAVSVEAFEAALREMKVAAEDITYLKEKLTPKDDPSVVLRAGSGDSLVQGELRGDFKYQWDRLSPDKRRYMTADAAWMKVVDEVQNRLLGEFGLGDGKVIETEHPYEAKSHRWAKDVTIPEAESLLVTFSSKCVTYDDCAVFEVNANRKDRVVAKVGARVQLCSLENDQLYGTLVQMSEDSSKWRVCLDTEDIRQWLADAEAEAEAAAADAVLRPPEEEEEEEEEEEGKDESAAADKEPGGSAVAAAAALSAAIVSIGGRSNFATCGPTPQVVRVVFGEGQRVGDEIEAFQLDSSFVLAPYTVKGLLGDSGLARSAGVQPGWFLDVAALLEEPAFVDLQGEALGEMPACLAEVAANMEVFALRLEALLDVTSGITLSFTDSLTGKLLPSYHVRYVSGQQVGEEIEEIEVSEDGHLTLASFVDGSSTRGPAGRLGIRAGWRLCIYETLNLPANKDAVKNLSLDGLLEDPSQLLRLSDVTLAFEPDPNRGSSEAGFSFVAHSDEEETWREAVVVPSNTAKLSFRTDGDGIDYPERRWGVFSVVTALGKEPPSRGDVDKLAERWSSERLRATGIGAITIEPEDWDEVRLRALCAKHGWEFEWMSEDGERQRRIRFEGLRKAAARAKGADSESAWWRLDLGTNLARVLSGSIRKQNAPSTEQVRQDGTCAEAAKVDPSKVQLKTAPSRQT